MIHVMLMQYVSTLLEATSVTVTLAIQELDTFALVCIYIHTHTTLCT